MLGNDQKHDSFRIENMTARDIFSKSFVNAPQERRVSHVVMAAQLAPCAGGALLHY